ncbi:MAG: 4-hydroxythreonine-4-phosphate dehydrogenase PdxA [Planctomycetota bacterium]
MSKLERPLLGLTIGDPAGVGPEIVRSALADERVRRAVRLHVLGPAREAPADLGDAVWENVGDDEHWDLGRAQASAGRVALAALGRGAELASAGTVQALVTAPVSKEALWLAGERVEGQTTLLGRWAGVQVEMLAVAGPLRVLVATRHMPLREALDRLTTDLVVDRLSVLDRGLRRFGFTAPHLALAGLNPHAGEGGLLGSEDLELLVPAIESARKLGIDVTGPVSPDTVFLRGWRGEFDGVLALYHDQAFIPTKIVDPDRGLTILFGLPYLRVSPAHGTAFDIAGKGTARAENLIVAVLEAARWSSAQRVE